MSGLVEFAITDGTNTIDLLAANRTGKGFGVQRYIPGRPQLKNGGVWRDSSTESGRQLAFGVDTNINDAVTLTCSASSQNLIIEAFEELDLLLEKTRAYWETNWQQTPVYLRARAKGETTTRYALIFYAKYDEYFDPYGQLYAGAGFNVVTEEFILGIEHGLWLDLPPGQSESVPVTHEGNSGVPIDTTSSSFTSGQGMGLIVSNMYQSAATGGLQVIFRDDGGSFSSNLLDGNPPYNLFNSPTAVNDAVYFGSTLPFFGLIFDFSSITLAQSAWEIWNGSTWAAITVNGIGLSFSFAVSGITYAKWAPSAVSAWVKTLVGADQTNRYWIRARLTGSTGDGPVTQQNRHVYSTVTNYLEIDETEITGTKSATSRIELFFWRASSTNATVTLLMGLRSVERGTNFAAQLNAGGGNPVGVTAPTGGTTDPTGPGGGYMPATNLSVLTRVAIWTFSPTVMPQFFGQFRLYARIRTDDDTGESQIRYQTGVGSVQFGTYFTTSVGATKTIPTPTAGQSLEYVLVDLGYITLPLSGKAIYQTPVGNFHLALDVKVPSGKTIRIYNIVLLPVDEWTGEISGETSDVGAGNYQVILDGITNPKNIQAYVEQINELEPVTSALPFLHAGATQRLWFLFDFDTGNLNNSNHYSNPSIFASARVAKVDRNVSLRRFPA